MGWGDLDNGHLLTAMAHQFDVLVTVDRRLPQQQKVAASPIGVVVLRARSNRLSDLLPLVPALLEVIAEIRPGVVQEIVGQASSR